MFFRDGMQARVQGPKAERVSSSYLCWSREFVQPLIWGKVQGLIPQERRHGERKLLFGPLLLFSPSLADRVSAKPKVDLVVFVEPLRLALFANCPFGAEEGFPQLSSLGTKESLASLFRSSMKKGPHPGMWRFSRSLTERRKRR